MPSVRRREQQLVAALGIVAAITLFFSIVLGIPATVWLSSWLAIATTLAFFYLLWRFVRAHERIAAALEVDSEQSDG